MSCRGPAAFASCNGPIGCRGKGQRGGLRLIDYYLSADAQDLAG